MPSPRNLALPAHPFEENSRKIIVAVAVGFALATIGIVLRLFSRWLCKKRLELNDYLILAAYPLKLGLDITDIYMIKFGIGKHLQAVPLDHLRSFFKALYTGYLIYPLCVGLVKLSLLALYWAAFPTKKYVHDMSYGIGGLVVAWAIGGTLTVVFACQPIHKSWDTQIPGHCINEDKLYWGLQIPNIVTDFAILIMPFLPLSGLVINSSTKIQIGVIWVLGVVVCALDVVRLVVLLRLRDGLDITWDQLDAVMWTNLELSIAILVACLPVLRPLLQPRHEKRV